MPHNHRTKVTTRLAGLLASSAISAWMRTLDYRAALYDPSVDPVMPDHQRRIYIFWHENILCPLYLRGNCRMAILLSQHRDADILAEVARHSGFESVRGSTFRGAATAVRELLKKGQQMHLAITPDGPRGPRRHLAHGAVYLASKLQMPIVPIGVGYDRPWRTPTWDRFAIPRPFSRARVVVGPPLVIPQRLDRSAVEPTRERLDSLLNWLTYEAEQWATTGTRRKQELGIIRQGQQRRAA